MLRHHEFQSDRAYASRNNDRSGMLDTELFFYEPSKCFLKTRIRAMNHDCVGFRTVVERIILSFFINFFGNFGHYQPPTETSSELSCEFPFSTCSFCVEAASIFNPPVTKSPKSVMPFALHLVRNSNKIPGTILATRLSAQWSRDRLENAPCDLASGITYCFDNFGRLLHQKQQLRGRFKRLHRIGFFLNTFGFGIKFGSSALCFR